MSLNLHFKLSSFYFQLNCNSYATFSRMLNVFCETFGRTICIETFSTFFSVHDESRQLGPGRLQGGRPLKQPASHNRHLHYFQSKTYWSIFSQALFKVVTFSTVSKFNISTDRSRIKVKNWVVIKSSAKLLLRKESERRRFA